MYRCQLTIIKYLLISSVYLSLAHTVFAQEPDAGDLVNLPFEQLMKMDIVVTSASKQEEEVSRVSSSVFVITEKDIQRSGATSIPEVLNMAPGIQVSRINSSEWAVSSRGFNGLFSRYLLVLIDGRSVYYSFSNGVNWEEQNLNLQDIERIEVIRGPGGSLWGVNAVNGIVNIITRKADANDKTYLEAGGGSIEKRFINFSHSEKIGEKGGYRVSYNFNDREEFKSVKLNNDDKSAQSQRLSLISNWIFNKENSLNFHANYQQIDTYTLWSDYSYDEPYFQIIAPKDKKTGGAFQVEWSSILNPTLELNLRLSKDFSSNTSSALSYDTKNTDLDTELSWQPNKYHSINTGINTHFSTTQIDPSESFDLKMTPNKNDTDVLSFFFQDKINFSDTLNITAGVRIDKHSLADSSIQPTLRGFWAFNPKNSIWASYSRAEGTPSLTSVNYTQVLALTVPPSAESQFLPIGIYVESGGNSDKGGDNTQVDTLELGYRLAPNQRFNADIVFYYNKYKRLLRLDEIDQFNPTYAALPTPHLEYTTTINNNGSGTTQGAELAVSWQISDYWHLQYSGTYGQFNLNYSVDESPFSGVEIPRTKHSLRSLINIGDNWNIDSWITKVAGFESQIDDIESHWSLNFRLAWKASENITLSLNGKNLIDKDRVEFIRETFYTDSYVVPRYYFASLEWRLR